MIEIILWLEEKWFSFPTEINLGQTAPWEGRWNDFSTRISQPFNASLWREQYTDAIKSF